MYIKCFKNTVKNSYKHCDLLFTQSGKTFIILKNRLYLCTLPNQPAYSAHSTSIFLVYLYPAL